MWILVTRNPKPDVALWHGRRGLAMIDAVIWPALWVFLVANAPFETGIAGVVVIALALLCGVRRAQRALWQNERYWFTSWRWGKPLLALLVVAWLLRLLMMV
jgi:hypothetical protein